MLSGQMGGINITDAFLFIMAAWIPVPSLIALLSLTLRPAASRWANLVTGVVSLVMLAATFLAGSISARYTLQAGVEALLILLMVSTAWTWPRCAVVGVQG
jgi:hypothetical protein